MKPNCAQSMFYPSACSYTSIAAHQNVRYQSRNLNHEAEAAKFNEQLFKCMSSAYCFGCDDTKNPSFSKISKILNGAQLSYEDYSSYCLCGLMQQTSLNTRTGCHETNENKAKHTPPIDTEEEKMVYFTRPSYMKDNRLYYNSSTVLNSKLDDSSVNQPSVVSFNGKSPANAPEHETSEAQHYNSTIRQLNIDGEDDLVQKEKLKFTIRSDVVKKTILRSFKKFYINEFKSYYNFTKRIRRKHYNISIKAFTEAKEYVLATFPEFNHIKDIHMFLIAIVDTKKKYAHQNSLFNEMRGKILNMLKLFNCEKFDELLQYPQIAALVTKFLRCPISEICRDKQDASVVEVYKKQINSIAYRCSATLSKAS